VADLKKRRADVLHVAPEIQFTHELRDTSRLLLRLLAVRIAKYGITLPQYFLLRQLWEEDGIGLGTVAERIQTTQPATVVIVDALEKRGLIERVRGVDDRRIVRIHLTEQGRQMRATLLEHAYDLAACSFGGMSPADAEHFRGSLRQIRENLRALDAQADTIGA
jgi:DNA-binding MarR family transcriptional regulator